ncbi:MAG: anaerobic ribonucleoside-triphosphate reductase activating protein [Chloroflexi bacterium]|nr:anaerobic ribonucleoside-triphosphate reductase activating protein [Chloroflexota bacterium]MBU1749527.1 anaerobic ribonucleoside-triphosphate reductase activating protein [Chloroflexota bacterium]MBU1878036.1 anaerobic ribonucleoside-triphosphate reductase activating protein [Chloroflexota bacterium]
MNLRIQGLVKTSLIEFPGHIATVVFTGGCNLACPYCHNTELVLASRLAGQPAIPVTDVLALLAERRGFVDGVVVSGGEATLQPGLLDFLRAVRALGLATKLDTNGSRPAVLRRLLTEGLLDYVALDLKVPLNRYETAVGAPPRAGAAVGESIRLILTSGIAHEFRTTVVPHIVAPADVPAMARTIAGAQRYYLQQFRPTQTLDPAYQHVTPYAPAVLHQMARAARAWVPTTVRGV